MNFDSLFLRFEGRISRQTFWAGMISLLAFGTVILVLSAMLDRRARLCR